MTIDTFANIPQHLVTLPTGAVAILGNDGRMLAYNRKPLAGFAAARSGRWDWCRLDYRRA